MELNKLNLFEIRFFRAVEEPELAEIFFEGHQNELARQNLDGLEFSRNNWANNPHVFIMALWSGQTIIGGSRIHLFHPDHPYPFEIAMLEHSPQKLVALERNKNKYQAEWCGLWLSNRFKGLGLAETMNRSAIAATHKFGLEVIYGICPRHTMDLFRTGGYRFMTLNDEVISFPYPTKDYISYIIECDVLDMNFTFRSEKQTIQDWLANPEGRVESSGLLGECIVQLTGFPSLAPDLLVKPESSIRENLRSNLYKFSKRFLSSDTLFPRAS